MITLLESVKTDFIEYLSNNGVDNSNTIIDKFELLKKNQRIKETEFRDYFYWLKRDAKEFVKFVSSFEVSKTKKSKSIRAYGSELFYEDDNWSVYLIKTYEASRVLGKGTMWCISGDDKKAEMYFDNYAFVHNLNIYFFISKIETYETDPNNYKIAVLLNDSNRIIYFNAPDKRIDKSELPDNFPDIKLEYHKIKRLPDIKNNMLVKVYDENIVDGIFIIPNNVVEIAEGVFYHFGNLKSVVIPNSVTKIGNLAFQYCENLKSIIIPNSVVEMEGGIFYNCEGLESVVIFDSITKISPSTFRNCVSLESVNIPNGITKIGKYAFSGCKSLESITIPNSVTEIGEGAFRYCYNLKSITISDSITEIGSGAFCNCKSLESITIPDSVIKIGDTIFRNCTSLGSIILPDNIITIEDWDFQNCVSLKSITIPDSVTEIGYGAFENCTSLKSITISDSVTKIGNDAFSNCDNIEIHFKGNPDNIDIHPTAIPSSAIIITD